MAVERGLTFAIGDALVALVDWAWPRVSLRVDEFVEKVAEAVRPQPQMSIRTLDGQVLTGLLVCDAGQVILFVGIRASGSGVATAPRPEPRDPRRYDDAIPLWAREVDPEELRHLEVDPYRRR